MAEKSCMTKNDLLKQLHTFEADLEKLENKLMSTVSIESHTNFNQLNKKIEKIEISFNTIVKNGLKDEDKNAIFKGNGYIDQREAV